MIYYGKRFDASLSGSRLVEVACDRCGRAYFYQLSRVGLGSASAPYAIGAGRAERAAAENARNNLSRRLEAESELVPCPGCGWINDELVAGYRRSQHRGLLKAAIIVGGVGIAASLICAWFLSRGPAADQGATSFFLVDGPIISLSLAAFLMLLQQGRRSLIRPNRNYPGPPTIPRGSPDALVRDPSTGDLSVAPRGPSTGDQGESRVSYQVGRSSLPWACCDCLGEPDPRSGFRHPLASAVEVVLPLCRACGRRWNRRKWAGAAIGLAATAAVALPILLLLKVDEIVFWLAVAALGTVAPIVGAMVAGRRAAPVLVRVVDRSRGIVDLRFRNRAFSEMAAAGAGARAPGI